MVIFRENTEDVYGGIEWATRHAAGRAASSSSSNGDGASASAPDSGIGIKPMSEFGSKRLVRMAIRYAIDNKRKTRHAGAQGQHHEVHRGGVQGLGLRAREGGVPRPDRHRGRSRRTARRRRQGRHQGPHRRQHVPADPAAARRVQRARDAEPQRRLPLGRRAAQVGGLGLAPGANIGDEIGDLRGDARHGAEVHRQGHDQPRLGDPVGRDDARAPGLGRGGGPDQRRASRRRSRRRR